MRMYGKIIKKLQREITVKKEGDENTHIEFSLDNVESEFIPLAGDYIYIF